MAIGADRHALEQELTRLRARVAELERQQNPLSLVRRMIDHAADAFEVIDPDTGQFLDVNRTACSMHGYTHDEYVKMSVGDIDPWVHLVGWDKSITRIRAEGSQVIESRHRRRDGSLFPVEISACLIDEPRELVVAVVRDISDRKQIESQLRESQALLQTFVSNTPAAVAMVDTRMCYLAWSKRWIEDFKLNENNLLGHCHFDLFPDVPEEWKAILRRCMTGVIEHRDVDSFVRADGRTEYLRWTVQPWYRANGDVGGLILFSEVITQRIEAEAAVRRNKERLRLALDGAHGGVWDWQIQEDKAWWSPEMYTLWGAEPADYMHLANSLDIVHPDDRESIRLALAQTFAEGNEYRSEYRIRHSHRGERWIMSRGQLQRDVLGKPVRLLGISLDVTEQKRAQLELLESEHEYRIIAESTSSAILTVDVDGRIVFANRAASMIFGYDKPAMLGMLIEAIIPGERTAPKLLTMLANGGVPTVSVFPHQIAELQGRRSDNRLLALEGSVATHQRQGQYVLTAILRDVSERNRAQEELRRREMELAHVSRLSTLGATVAEIAHEINQPLYTIGNFAEACLNEIGKREGGNLDAIAEWLQRIHQASVRSGDVLRRIAGFARKTDTNQQTIDLRRVIANAIEMIQFRARRGAIYIGLRSDTAPLYVEIDHVQVEQVLINLMVNACDAAESQPKTQRRIQVNAYERLDADQIVVEVSDNGPGICDDVLQRLYEPFVTTKPQGLGMGLAICRSIVERHNGTIEGTNNPSGGAVFRITLPRSKSGEHG